MVMRTHKSLTGSMIHVRVPRSHSLLLQWYIEKKKIYHSTRRGVRPLPMREFVARVIAEFADDVVKPMYRAEIKKRAVYERQLVTEVNKL